MDCEEDDQQPGAPSSVGPPLALRRETTSGEPDPPTKMEAVEHLLFKLEKLFIDSKVLGQEDLDGFKKKFPMGLDTKIAAIEQYLLPPFRANQLEAFLQDEVKTAVALATKFAPGSMQDGAVSALVAKIQGRVLEDKTLFRGLCFYVGHICKTLDYKGG